MLKIIGHVVKSLGPIKLVYFFHVSYICQATKQYLVGAPKNIKFCLAKPTP